MVSMPDSPRIDGLKYSRFNRSILIHVYDQSTKINIFCPAFRALGQTLSPSDLLPGDTLSKLWPLNLPTLAGSESWWVSGTRLGDSSPGLALGAPSSRTSPPHKKLARGQLRGASG